MPTTDIQSTRAHLAARSGYRRSLFAPLLRERVSVKANPYPDPYYLPCATEVMSGSARASRNSGNAKPCDSRALGEMHASTKLHYSLHQLCLMRELAMRLAVGVLDSPMRDLPIKV